MNWQRFFRPSALRRVQACPASCRIQADVVRMVPKWEKFQTQAAKNGTAVHEAIAFDIKGEKREALPSSLESVVAKCLSYIEWLPGERIIEERISLDLGDGIALEGTPDLVIAGDGVADVVDWKSGYADYGSSADSYQGAAYCAAVAMKYRTQATRFHLVSPRSSARIESRSCYAGKGFISSVIAHIRKLYDHAENDTIPCAGEHCRFCLGLPLCKGPTFKTKCEMAGIKEMARQFGVAAMAINETSTHEAVMDLNIETKMRVAHLKRVSK